MRTVFPTLLGSMLLTCCSPTYAPPVRTTHFGMPGHLQGGKAELAGGLSLNSTICGGPVLAFAPTDWLQLEGGVDLSKDDHEWEMYFGGLRLTLGYQGVGAFAAVDLEFGGGLGKGGEYEGNEESTGWEDHAARGLYVGVGVGITADWFSVFVRGRHQASWATGIPETSWWTFLIGTQAAIYDTVNLYAGVGGYKYGNSVEDHSDFILEFGLSIELPIFYEPPPKKKRIPEFPIIEKKESKPWPPPVPVKKESPRVVRVEKKKDEVTREPQAELEVRPEVKVKPCPAGAVLVGEPPPFSFEMFCAVPDPKVRWKYHGWYVGWYGNGQKASEGEYVDGKRQGTWIFWHNNGQKRLEAGYRMGEKHGRWTFWDKDGVETRVIDYRD